MLRAAVCHVLSHLRRQPLDLVVEEVGWREDRTLGTILRAATDPASTGGWGSALAGGNLAADFIAGLAPASAASRLIAAGVTVDLTGISTADLPWPTSNPPVVFVAEGAPIPVGQGVIGGGTVGAVKKMALILTCSGNLASYSTPAAVPVLTQMLTESASRALNAAIFSTAAADAVRPAGILNGVTPITAAAGGGAAAAAADVGKLAQAIGLAGGGENLMLFADPGTATRLRLLFSAGTLPPIAAAVAITPGTLIAVEAGGFASAFSGVPDISTSTETVLHMEDTTPLPIGSAATPNTIAAPSRSLWQENAVAVRCLVDTAWAMRAAGLVQVINGVTW